MVAALLLLAGAVGATLADDVEGAGLVLRRQRLAAVEARLGVGLLEPRVHAHATVEDEAAPVPEPLRARRATTTAAATAAATTAATARDVYVEKDGHF